MKYILHGLLILLPFGAHAKMNVGRSLGDSLKEVVNIACVQAARASKSIKKDKDSDKSYPIVQDSDAGPDSWVEWFEKEF